MNTILLFYVIFPVGLDNPPFAILLGHRHSALHHGYAQLTIPRRLKTQNFPENDQV